MKITRETIEELGWEREEMGFKSHSLVWYKKTYIVKSETFHLTLREESNTIGRDWFVHVDNCDFESVASLDVATFEQIDALVELCVPERNN